MTLPDFTPYEVLLRSLRKKDISRTSGKVKWNALRVTGSGDGKLSLIRQLIGDDEAKRCARDYVHGDLFVGFGRATYERLRNHCEAIEDDPTPFVGHANMTLGYPTPPAAQDPQAVMSEEVVQAQEKLSRLSDELQVVLDPDPSSTAWNGPHLGNLDSPERSRG